MNYIIHYNLLINRARSRILDDYTEKHHIIPKCLGGSNTKENLVSLTPEEHYVAHQLLVKIHPDNKKLLHAAMMMLACNKNQQRNNRIYGWLRRRYVIECRKRTGKNNPSYGKKWYHNPKTKEAGSFKEDKIPTGWVLGRVPKKKCYCTVCGSLIKNSKLAKFCKQHRPNKDASKIKAIERFNQQTDEFIKYIQEGYSFDASLKLVGYKNYNMKFGVGKRAQNLLNDLNIQRPLSPKRPPKASA